MTASGSNFSADVLAGRDARYRRVVDGLRGEYGFDFVGLGLTAFVGAPLRWVYSAGATSARHKRIALAPGHGIGGIVVKSGKPMLFLDIDRDLDPQSYSSYPIVFAEDLHSFCCLPLSRAGVVVGALLAAFRSSAPEHEASYRRLVSDLGGRLADLDVTSEDFMNFEAIAGQDSSATASDTPMGRSELSRVIRAQEDERKRISRELHDGVAQEVLSVSFALRQLEAQAPTEAQRRVASDAVNVIDRILEELHNISVELRPLSLDHLGFVAALHSQATVLERTYGTRIVFEGGA